MNQVIKLFKVQIETWGLPITIRAYDIDDAEGLTRIIFDIPTGVSIKAVPEEGGQ